MGWVVNATLRPLYPPGKTRYPLYRRLGGPQGRSGQVRKISPPTGIRSPDRPARSQSLYRLSYRGSHTDCVIFQNKSGRNREKSRYTAVSWRSRFEPATSVIWRTSSQCRDFLASSEERCLLGCDPLLPSSGGLNLRLFQWRVVDILRVEEAGTLITLILRRSRTGTVWFYTSTSNKREARPKLYTKSLTSDLKRMHSRLTLVRISVNL